MVLEKTIKSLIAKVDGHIGANGKAHLPADLDRAGFMTPEQVKALDDVEKTVTLQVKALDDVEKTVTLWEGSASAVGTIIQLTDNRENYRKIRITADNLNKNQTVVDYIPLNGWVGVVSTNIFDGQTNIFSLFKLTIFFEEKTAKITLNNRVDSTSNANTPINDGLMQVVKIEGVL